MCVIARRCCLAETGNIFDLWKRLFCPVFSCITALVLVMRQMLGCVGRYLYLSRHQSCYHSISYFSNMAWSLLSSHYSSKVSLSSVVSRGMYSSIRVTVSPDGCNLKWVAPMCCRVISCRRPERGTGRGIVGITWDSHRYRWFPLAIVIRPCRKFPSQNYLLCMDATSSAPKRQPGISLTGSSISSHVIYAICSNTKLDAVSPACWSVKDSRTPGSFWPIFALNTTSSTLAIAERKKWSLPLNRSESHPSQKAQMMQGF